MSSYYEPVPADERAEEQRLLEKIAERRRRRKKPPTLSMNMTPMIDIVFQLIIFFMLVSEFQNMELEQITLPFALRATEVVGPDERLVINVTARGETTVLRRPYTPQQLSGLLANRARTSRDADGLSNVAVKIRADADCEYFHVQRILTQCMERGIWKLSFGANHTEDVGALAY